MYQPIINSLKEIESQAKKLSQDDIDVELGLLQYVSQIIQQRISEVEAEKKHQRAILDNFALQLFSGNTNVLDVHLANKK